MAKAIRNASERRNRFIPSNADIREMTQPSTSLRAVLARMVAFTGLDASELCTLAWYDVDSVVGLRIRGARHRIVPLPPMLSQALREWRAVAPASRMNLVFPNSRGEAFSPSGMTALFRRGGAGGARCSLYSLRAFFMAWCRAGPPDGKGGLSNAQLYRLLGRSPPWPDMVRIIKFGDEPIDLERYAAAERAVFSREDSSP